MQSLGGEKRRGEEMRRDTEQSLEQMQAKLAETQKESRENVARLLRLGDDLRQQREHQVNERTQLLAALARIGGEERVRRELEVLGSGEDCIDALGKHVAASCKAR